MRSLLGMLACFKQLLIIYYNEKFVRNASLFQAASYEIMRSLFGMLACLQAILSDLIITSFLLVVNICL